MLSVIVIGGGAAGVAAARYLKHTAKLDNFVVLEAADRCGGRAHTIQGTFCDPYYGGNTDFVGWDLIGYPGVRLAVTPNEQRLDPRLTPTHRSAYEHAMFSRKRPARASLEDEMSPWPRT